MSATQHIEWLNLVEKTGPFLAVGALDEAFPQGLEKVETRKRQRVRSAYDEWRDAVDDSDSQLDALHREWLRLVFEEVLEYDSTILKPADALPATFSYREQLTSTELKPDFAVLSGDKLRLIVACYTPDTDLYAPIASETWAASPVERMTTLCRALGVQVALVTDGEQWTLISVPTEGSSSIGTWYARIWQQEPVTLQAFVSLLDVRRCFGPAEASLQTLFLRSMEHQDELTDTLGEQVRRAVEVLVQALDRADLDRDRKLLQGLPEAQLYEAGLTIMMRLVVLLCAEERKLLLLGEPIYDRYYAVSTLRSQLLEDKERSGEEVLEKRHDAWSRLLAVFRAVFCGIEHETLRLPALGGSLFDPDRFPFLEGRPAGTSWVETMAVPLLIDNRTVLMLLTALQVLEHRSGAQFLSYEALDVEQIGHVYEGLLERTVKRVSETTLGLIGSQKAVNPNITLREIEAEKAIGGSELLAYLLDKTGRSETALRNALAKPVDEVLYHRILVAVASDIALADRLKPFAHLIRTDSWGDPLAYRKDAFIVTLGEGRRETGTHYTPKSLTEPIVQHTLEPLAYKGPSDGKPRQEWQLESPAQLLALKVCDLAMGSGAFLVQTCRWLSERLIEAWDAEEKAGNSVSVEGVVLDQPGGIELLPRDQAERLLIARRLIANRCLYGVDINPMAVELAKLSLWLVTMMRNRPFNFLDHAIKCGDSLLGISQLKQIERFSLRDPDHAEPLLETANLWRHIEQAAELRRHLEVTPSHTVAQITEKARLHGEAETQLVKLRAAADFLVAVELAFSSSNGRETRRAIAANRMQDAWKSDIAEFQRLAGIEVNGRHPFHWPLEFPEVFKGEDKSPTTAGFDAFVGNPPFMGEYRIIHKLGAEYRELVICTIAGGQKGKADLCVYFFLRAFALLSKRGLLGLIGTNSIGQGDSAKVGLRGIRNLGGRIIKAVSSMHWPGAATIEVALLWIAKSGYGGGVQLNEAPVEDINEYLVEETIKRGAPKKLQLNAGKSFKGCEPYGAGFILEREEAAGLIAANKRNADVIKPYLTGDDLNSSPDQSPSRFAIFFQNWPLNRDQTERSKDSPCAEDYPECLAILDKRVRSERATKATDVAQAPWWLFWRARNELFAALKDKKRALARSRHSNINSWAFVPTDIVLSDALVVLALDQWSDFAIVQSTVHDVWINVFGSSIRTDLRYTSSTCFETFPFPGNELGLDLIGERYYHFRCEIAVARKEGLTEIYNRFHDQTEKSHDVDGLRGLRRQLDLALANAYGWGDLAANEGSALRHDFHETKRGVRWTLHPEVCTDILDRLLVLNHQRCAEEVATGLHDKKAKGGTAKARRASKLVASQDTLEI